MAYLIEGHKCPVVFLANPRTGSTSISNALMEMGASKQGKHHSPASEIPFYSLVVHTVRHPCDLFVSMWYKSHTGTPFSEYIDEVINGSVCWFHPNLFNKWPDKPNYVLRYETLQYEFEVLCYAAGLSPVKLKRTPSRRPSGIKWQNMFSGKLFDKVYKRFQEEMEEYGYGRN